MGNDNTCWMRTTAKKLRSIDGLRILDQDILSMSLQAWNPTFRMQEIAVLQHRSLKHDVGFSGVVLPKSAAKSCMDPDRQLVYPAEGKSLHTHIYISMRGKASYVIPLSPSTRPSSDPWLAGRLAGWQARTNIPASHEDEGGTPREYRRPTSLASLVLRGGWVKRGGEKARNPGGQLIDKGGDGAGDEGEREGG